MYRNALEDEFRGRLARLKGRLRLHDRGVLLGFAFSIVPIPPVALVGFIIGLFNVHLLARRTLPESERHLVRLSLVASVLSFAAGAALFAAIGWLVLHALSFKLAAVWNWLQDLADGVRLGRTRLPPGRGLQDV